MRRRKRIAVFGCSLTSRYKRDLCRALNIAAEEFDIDLIYFNSFGKLRNITSVDEDQETGFLDYVNLDQFDGIIFDGEGYNIEGMAEKVERKLRTAKCPVISISSHVEGFYNIEFDDAGGLRGMVEHLIDHHHFTHIAFMSGYLKHPDARTRLAEFRTVMREYGFPEDGAGMFEGDFWYNKGVEAAHYFLTLPERPEAIVCANDYMAISLINALRQQGINVPEDIVVTGYDGTIEGKEYLPHLSSVTRERTEIAQRALKFLIDLSDGGDASRHDLRVSPKPIYSQSCGCKPLEYRHVLEKIDRLHDEKRILASAISTSESVMIKLNKADSVRKMESSNNINNLFSKVIGNIKRDASLFLFVKRQNSFCKSSKVYRFSR